MSKTRIEWTDITWNPTTGCSPVSEGCAHCYAARMARRLKAMGQPKYANGFEVAMHEDALALPLQWKKSRRVFVNSMSDLLHEGVPDDFILRVFEVMNRASWHLYQVLSKRAARLAKLGAMLPWSPHIWAGVTVERDDYRDRIDHLRACGASTKFLSLEPLLGPLTNLDLSDIDWVIVGGESGPGARPMQAAWVTDIRDQCVNGKVPFFFKQWGGVRKKEAGRELDGRTWDEFPAGARLRSAGTIGSAQVRPETGGL